MKEEVDVVAALIRKDDKFLLCQRNKDDNYGNLWEFPGGAIEKNESFQEAIEREMAEELDIIIEAHNLVNKFTDENENLKIKIYLFECVIIKGIIRTKDCQDFGFFTLEQAMKLDLAPADKKIAKALKV